MIETVTALPQTQAQEISNWIVQIPAQQDVDRFNSVYQTPEVTGAEQNFTVVTDASSEKQMEAATLGEKILDTVSRLDGTYKALFPENFVQGLSPVADSTALSDASPNSFEDMLQHFREINMHATQVSIWSTEVGLLSTSVSKGTQGIQTLFRNSG